MLTNTQLNECKSNLIKRQNELIGHMDNRYGLFESTRDSISELSMYDNHPADIGTETYERGKDLALNEHAEKELEEINEALHAIEEGTYGICTKCGKDIGFERLLAVPTTGRCREHAEEDIFTRERPVEEEVFSPNINPDEVTEETQVGYDAEDAWQDVSKYGTSETASDFYEDKEHYDEMYPNSNERIGTTEDIEDIASVDIDGSYNEDEPNT